MCIIYTGFIIQINYAAGWIGLYWHRLFQPTSLITPLIQYTVLYITTSYIRPIQSCYSPLHAYIQLVRGVGGRKWGYARVARTPHQCAHWLCPLYLILNSRNSTCPELFLSSVLPSAVRRPWDVENLCGGMVV